MHDNVTFGVDDNRNWDYVSIEVTDISILDMLMRCQIPSLISLYLGVSLYYFYWDVLLDYRERVLAFARTTSTLFLQTN